MLTTFVPGLAMSLHSAALHWCLGKTCLLEARKEATPHL